MAKWQANGEGNMGPFGPLSLKGQAVFHGVPTFLKQLPITIGGIAGEDLPWGRVVSVTQSEPHKFLLGHPTGSVVRGITIFEPSISVADPAKPDYEFAGRPIDVMLLGMMDVQEYIEANGPQLGGQMIFRASDGKIGFIPASTTTVPTGCEKIPGSVVETLDPNGAKCWFDFLSAPMTNTVNLTQVEDVDITVTGTTYPKTISMACDTDFIKILYTVDGTVPEPGNGDVYEGKFTVAAACTVKARAYREGYQPSDVASETLS